MSAPGTDDQPPGAGFALPTLKPQPSAAGVWVACLQCGDPCQRFFCDPCEQFLIENYMESGL